MNTFTKKERNMFLIGNAGIGMMASAFWTGILYYYQSVLCLPALAISTITAITTIWDGLNDPLTGVIIDRTRTKWGKMRPYVMFGPFATMIVTLLPFINAQWSESNSAAQNAWIVIWAGFAYILFQTVYEYVAIGFNGMPSRMTSDEKQRDKLVSVRYVVLCCGDLLISYFFVAAAQKIGNIFVANGATYSDGLQYGCMVFAAFVVIISLPLALCGGYAKERIPILSEEKKGLLATLKILWSCKPYRRIFISGLIGSMCSFGMSNVTFIIYYFGDNGGSGQSHLLHTLLIYGMSFASNYIGILLAPKVVERMEKKKARILFGFGGLVTPIGMLVAYLIDGTGLYKWYWVAYLMLVFGIGGLLGGIGSGTSTLMSYDCIDYEEYHTGYRPEGAIMGASSFLTKLTSSVPAFLSGIVFTVVGFSGDGLRAVNEALAASPSDDYLFATAPEFASMRAAMFFLLTVPGIISTLVTWIPLYKYEITNEYHKKIMEELRIRRSEASK